MVEICSTKAFRSEYGLHAALGACRILELEGRQYLSIGLDATPETVPNLINAIDPPEYLGLNASMAVAVLVILVGIWELWNFSLIA